MHDTSERRGAGVQSKVGSCAKRATTSALDTMPDQQSMTIAMPDTLLTLMLLF